MHYVRTLCDKYVLNYGGFSLFWQEGLVPLNPFQCIFPSQNQQNVKFFKIELDIEFYLDIEIEFDIELDHEW